MRMLAFAKQFFGWCVGFGYIDRSPIADLKAGVFGVEEKARERVLTDDGIRAFWNADALRHRALLRFLLLTGLRIGEAHAADREWLGADHWLALRAKVMKNDKPHRAYFSNLARKQLEPEAKPHLFRTVSPTVVQAAVRRWQDRRDIESRWTPHDLRRPFASRLGDPLPRARRSCGSLSDAAGDAPPARSVAAVPYVVGRACDGAIRLSTQRLKASESKSSKYLTWCFAQECRIPGKSWNCNDKKPSGAIDAYAWALRVVDGSSQGREI